MNEEKYNNLMIKLSKALECNGEIPFVSPKSKSSGDCGGSTSSEALLITSKLKVEDLGDNMKMFVHTLLHKLYGSGSSHITKDDIKDLHNVISKNINHFKFDRLDYE